MVCQVMGLVGQGAMASRCGRTGRQHGVLLMLVHAPYVLGLGDGVDVQQIIVLYASSYSVTDRCAWYSVADSGVTPEAVV
jgi:hypothetical protein